MVNCNSVGENVDVQRLYNYKRRVSDYKSELVGVHAYVYSYRLYLGFRLNNEEK